MAESSVIPAERIERAIYDLRGQRVMLDEDLAELYGVTTKRLNEQVKRNPLLACPLPRGACPAVAPQQRQNG